MVERILSRVGLKLGTATSIEFDTLRQILSILTDSSKPMKQIQNQTAHKGAV